MIIHARIGYDTAILTTTDFILFDTETGLEYAFEVRSGDTFEMGVALRIRSAAPTGEGQQYGRYYTGRAALSLWEQLSGLNDGNGGNLADFLVLHDEGYNAGAVCLEKRAAFETAENERIAERKTIDDHLVF